MPSLKSNITVFAAQHLPTTSLSPKSCIRFRKMIQVWWDTFRSTSNIRAGGSPLVGHQSLIRRYTHLYSPYVKYKPSALYLRKQDNYDIRFHTVSVWSALSNLFWTRIAQSIYWLNYRLDYWELLDRLLADVRNHCSLHSKQTSYGAHSTPHNVGTQTSSSNIIWTGCLTLLEDI
jgi:hypothetical protein